MTPYRALAAGSGAAGSGAACLVADDRPAIVRRRDPGSVNVLDLTAMWAGPLCTLLLAEWRARVTTVEPSVRTDGLRGSPAQFAVLDRHKERVDLDLRTTPGRAAFESLVAEADVLVESFSARVMPNLGYDAGALRAVNPRLTTVSIRAYAGCEWVAYGRGVHATSGLGMINGRPQPASIAYPDPLTGFAAFARDVGGVGRRRTARVGRGLPRRHHRPPRRRRRAPPLPRRPSRRRPPRGTHRGRHRRSPPPDAVSGEPTDNAHHSPHPPR